MTGSIFDVEDFVLRLVRAGETERENLLNCVVGSRQEPAVWQALLAQIDQANAVLARGGSGQDQQWFDWRRECRQRLKTLLDMNGHSFFKLIADGQLTVEAISSDEVEHVARHYAPPMPQQPAPRQQSAGTAAGHYSAGDTLSEQSRRQQEESRERFNTFVEHDRTRHAQHVDHIRYNRRLDEQIAEQINYNDFSDSWNRD